MTEDLRRAARGSAASSATPRPRPDPAASMSLLAGIVSQPIEPDYAVVAARGAPAGGRRWALAGVALLAGALFAVAALQTTRAAPALESERRDLINRVQAAEAEQDRLRAEATALEGDIDRLRAAALGGDEAARALEGQIARLGPAVGTAAVRGPGVVLVADDALGPGEDVRDQVLDLDLQVMVNGLWQAGAEAVAVNGHRLSALTAIRGAGDAITVDYRSLTRPYRVEAIGDPRTLQARWGETPGGAWWQELAANRHLRYEVSEARDLTLPSDPGLTLRHARRAA